jgi:hypothetical protein
MSNAGKAAKLITTGESGSASAIVAANDIVVRTTPSMIAIAAKITAGEQRQSKQVSTALGTDLFVLIVDERGGT